MRHRTLLIVSAALLFSGCDRKAGGQTVAVVNGEEITASELNAELQAANVPAGFDKKVATSRVLEALIDRRLLEQQARADGIDKSPDFLNRQRRANEQLLISMLAQRKLKTAELPSAAEVASFEASRPEMFSKREDWTISQLIYATPTDPKVNPQIAATQSLDALAQVLTNAGIPFTRSQAKISSAAVPHELYAKIEALPPGDPFIVPTGDHSVANAVSAREPTPIMGDAARPLAVGQMRQEQGQKQIAAQVKDLRAKAKVDYKEGFKPGK